MAICFSCQHYMPSDWCTICNKPIRPAFSVPLEQDVRPIRSQPQPGAPKPHVPEVQHPCFACQMLLAAGRLDCPACGAPQTLEPVPTSVNITAKALIVHPNRPDAYPTIAAALAAAGPGSRLEVYPGTYRDPLVIDTLVAIIAMGATPDVIIETSGTTAVKAQAPWAMLRGFTVRAHGTAETPAVNAVDIRQGRFLTEDCDISAATMTTAVRVHGADAHPTIRRCHIHEGTGSGIRIAKHANALVEYCYIEGHAKASVVVASNSNPTFRNCVIRSGARFGIVVSEHSTGRFENCDIHGHGLHGVQIEANAQPTFLQCQIHHNGQTGVLVTGKAGGELWGCAIFENAHANIEIREHAAPTLRYCRLYRGRASGVSVYSDGLGLFERCDIFEHAQDGITCRTGSSPRFVCCCIGPNQQNGVRITEQGNATFADCDIVRNEEHGANISTGSTLTLQRCIVTSNRGYGVVVNDGTAYLNGSALNGNSHGLTSAPSTTQLQFMRSALPPVSIADTPALERRPIGSTCVPPRPLAPLQPRTPPAEADTSPTAPTPIPTTTAPARTPALQPVIDPPSPPLSPPTRERRKVFARIAERARGLFSRAPLPPGAALPEPLNASVEPTKTLSGQPQPAKAVAPIPLPQSQLPSDQPASEPRRPPPAAPPREPILRPTERPALATPGDKPALDPWGAYLEQLAPEPHDATGTPRQPRRPARPTQVPAHPSVRPGAPLSVWVSAFPGGPLTQQRQLRAVIFDLDGTLADTRPVMTETLRALAREAGQELTSAAIARVLHLGFPKFLAPLGLSPARERYWDVYARHALAARGFPWALPLLTMLQERGIRTAVVTALPRRRAETVLTAAGALGMINLVVGSDDVGRPKPAPDGVQQVLEHFRVRAADAVVVGDSATDIAAGQAAGCLTISAGWGFTPLHRLAQSAPDLAFAEGAAFDAWLRGRAESFAGTRCPTCPAYFYRGIDVMAQCEVRCSTIANVLPVPATACQRCGEPDASDRLCDDCRWRKGPHYVASTFCAWLYTAGYPLAEALRMLKGVDQPPLLTLALPLGRLFLAASFGRVTGLAAADALNTPLDGVIVPVPSSDRAWQLRGYAPVERLLTAFFAPLLAPQAPLLRSGRAPFFHVQGTSEGRAILAQPWPTVVAAVNTLGQGWHLADALEKVSDVEVKQLGKAERVTAVRGAYRLRPDAAARVRGQTVYLVDDLITTGETTRECARILVEEGQAKAVHVIALARNHRQQRMSTGDRCPRCGEGFVVRKERRSDRKPFYGCSKYNRHGCTWACEIDELEHELQTARSRPSTIQNEAELPF